MTVCFAFLVTKFQAFCLPWFGLLHIDQNFPHDWQGINMHVHTQLSVVIWPRYLVWYITCAILMDVMEKGDVNRFISAVLP